MYRDGGHDKRTHPTPFFATCCTVAPRSRQREMSTPRSHWKLKIEAPSVPHSRCAFDTAEKGRSRAYTRRSGTWNPDGRSDEAALDGEDGGFGARGDVELGQDAPDVLGGGAGANEERVRDLPISATSGKET
jgi:hypothetical protein